MGKIAIYAFQALALFSVSVALKPPFGKLVSSGANTLGKLNPLFRGSTDPANVRFFLYNNRRQYSTKFYSSDEHAFEELIYQNGSVQDSGFIVGAPVVVLTHGFRSGHVSSDDSTFPQSTKNEYLREANGTIDRNIIIVDWSSLASPKQNFVADAYLLAVGNIAVPGKRLADILGYYIKNNYTNFSDIHLVGHSLGSHVSGVAGDEIQTRFRKKVARISGLDPAGPGFYLFGRSLRKDDASFVDVIHTSRGTYGKFTRVGHVDFYSNLGTLGQKGCQDGALEFIEDVGTLGTCSHSESHKLFSRSINDPEMKACKSNDFRYVTFQGCIEEVGAEVAVVGEHVDTETPEGKYYFDAADYLK